jgi:hypothetical protein
MLLLLLLLLLFPPPSGLLSPRLLLPLLLFPLLLCTHARSLAPLYARSRFLLLLLLPLLLCTHARSPALLYVLPFPLSLRLPLPLIRLLPLLWLQIFLLGQRSANGREHARPEARAPYNLLGVEVWAGTRV